MARTHWCGEDLNTIDTTLALLPGVLPVFDRKPFGRNHLRDVILRPSIVGAEPVPARLLISEYGTRMAVRATLPPEHSVVPDVSAAARSFEAHR